MKSKVKKVKSMAEVTKGYEKFMEGKELRKDGKEQFEKAISKAVKPKKKLKRLG